MTWMGEGVDVKSLFLPGMKATSSAVTQTPGMFGTPGNVQHFSHN